MVMLGFHLAARGEEFKRFNSHLLHGDSTPHKSKADVASAVVCTLHTSRINGQHKYTDCYLRSLRLSPVSRMGSPSISTGTRGRPNLDLPLLPASSCLLL